jgi:hypothetical protein
MSAVTPRATKSLHRANDAAGHKRWVFVGVPSGYFSAESGLAISPKSN